MDLVKKARYVWSKFEDGFGQNTQNELVKTMKNITCSGRDLEILGRQSTKEEKPFFDQMIAQTHGTPTRHGRNLFRGMVKKRPRCTQQTIGRNHVQTKDTVILRAMGPRSPGAAPDANVTPPQPAW